MKAVLLVLVAILVGACGGSTPATATPTTGQATPPASQGAASASPTTAPASTVPATTPPASASATPPPSASPSPSPSAPITTSPSPTSDAAAITTWATEVCDINTDFLTGSQAIATAVPDPPERTVAALKQLYRDRSPRITELMTTALERTRTLGVVPGAEPYQDALQTELAEKLSSHQQFDRDAEAATSVEDLQQAVTDEGSRNIVGLTEASRAVSALPLPIADAMAAVTTGCRFFEFDARARLRGAVTGDFSTPGIDDPFDAPGAWHVGPFDGGSVEVGGGTLTVAFTSNGGTHTVATGGQVRAIFDDVRVESTYSVEPNALSGLACRDTGSARYAVQVNSIGLVLIYRWSPDQRIIGRRTPPRDAVVAKRIDLAIECVGGRDGKPFVIAVYLDGERIAEVVDDRPIAREGAVGMFAQSVGRPSRTAYEGIKVLTTGD